MYMLCSWNRLLGPRKLTKVTIQSFGSDIKNGGRKWAGDGTKPGPPSIGTVPALPPPPKGLDGARNHCAPL